ncbi:hypothetical protein LR48_Vigan17s001100 [Vigna angularis]|uniref:Uncharacterized protein n=1 Tax=Phaseolus angularis TaxID=3914 RepID=A0A0L9T2V2_PHAAN|nr:hypothetical protein LR48_Vigan17s001100 [Vigna angularis]
MKIHVSIIPSQRRSGYSFEHLESLRNRRLAAQERQRLNDAPQLLSRGGYAILEKKIRKSRADALGLESLDLAPALARMSWLSSRLREHFFLMNKSSIPENEVKTLFTLGKCNRIVSSNKTW